jgi:hypothetical protein
MAVATRVVATANARQLKGGQRWGNKLGSSVRLFLVSREGGMAREIVLPRWRRGAFAPTSTGSVLAASAGISRQKTLDSIDFWRYPAHIVWRETRCDVASRGNCLLYVKLHHILDGGLLCLNDVLKPAVFTTAGLCVV